MVNAEIQQLKTWVEKETLSPGACENAIRWLTDNRFSSFRETISKLVHDANQEELNDAFRKKIEFGTGGIRGTMGAGPNRINARTLGEAAQGLCEYLLQAGGPDAPQRGLVIAHDTRNFSSEFAREVACIAAGNGVRAQIFPSFRSTPELSFALRYTNAVAGIVISASHNPPADNGFKAYWTDGGQVVPPHDKKILSKVQSVEDIVRCEYTEGVQAGLIETLDETVDREYHRRLAQLSLSPERNVRIVYTPLHGVGGTSVIPVLKHLGYNDLHLVEEQSIPSGDFPTVDNGVANPEDPNALKMAIQKAATEHADLVLASDPDADRLGCALPHPAKGWDAPPAELALNGNQIGALLCYYILKTRKNRGDFPAQGVVAKTIVTTDLTSIIARSFGAKVVDNLLVGFKYISHVIEQLPAGAEFLFGTEESHGYLAGSFVRDKDAAIAALLISECAASQKTQGRTLRAYLDHIYATYGYFRETQKSLTRPGVDGSHEIATIMNGLRNHPPAEIGGHPVFEVIDHQAGQATHVQTGKTRSVEGTTGNVMAFTFTEQGHTRVTARPSGTEPKIKFYVSATSVDHPDLASSDLSRTRTAVDALAIKILDGMLLAAEATLSPAHSDWRSEDEPHR